MDSTRNSGWLCDDYMWSINGLWSTIPGPPIQGLCLVHVDTKKQQNIKHNAGYLMKTFHFGQIDYRVGSVLVIVGDHSSLEEVQMTVRGEFL